MLESPWFHAQQARAGHRSGRRAARVSAAAQASAAARHWTEEMEAIARRAMRTADGYAYMYEHMAAAAKTADDRLRIVGGILGSVVGTSGVVSWFTVGGSMPPWAAILASVVGFAITILAVFSGVWQLTVTQTVAVLNQVSYAAVSRDIMCQLAQPRRVRPDAREYVRAKLGEIERLKLSAPAVSSGARKSYERKFRDNPIYSAEDQWGTTLADADAARAAARSWRGADSATSRSDESLECKARGSPAPRTDSDPPEPRTDSDPPEPSQRKTEADLTEPSLHRSNSEPSLGEARWPSLASIATMVSARDAAREESRQN
jgi:hypothetical protein